MKFNGTFLSIFVIGFLLFSSWSNSAVNYDRTVTIREQPIQLKTHKKPFEHKGFLITPKATFEIEARILSKRTYSTGKESKISPVDYALGWGPMSKYDVLKDLKIYQRGRWYKYRYKIAPILKSEIVRHSSNMHIIPSSKDIEKQVKRARKGEIVKLKGYLVNVSGEKGWYWNTSLSRTDSGNRSCEVFYVEDIEIVQ